MALNFLITVAEIVGGILSGSLALLSDAVHNLSDTASLAISYGARRISRKGPTEQKTFGYRRAELLGAFVNLVTLVLVALFLVKEAVERLMNPQPVDAPVMLVVASIGLAANVATGVLLYRDARTSLNVRSAFLHIVSDGISSVGVVAGGLLMLFYDLYWVDPLVTLGISAYLLYHSYAMLRETTHILMEGAPTGVDLEAVVASVQGLDRVAGLHHLHVWHIDEHSVALEAHVVIDREHLPHMETIKRRIKQLLSHEYAISHSTLEFEFLPCEASSTDLCYGHAAGVSAPERAAAVDA